MVRKRCFAAAIACVTTACLLSGCFLKREEGTQRTILKKGWQVAEDMKGWVAVPPTEPAKLEREGFASPARRLATHNVLPAALEGWFALSPATFKKYTGISLDPLNTKPGELWEMRHGRRVPKEKDGWVGVPKAFPKIVKKGSLGLANLHADQLIPKEMDGWVCVNADTLGKLAKEFELKKVTIKKKDKAETVPAQVEKK